MNVVDLEDVRRHRAAVKKAANAYVEDVAQFLVNAAIAQAERAFAVSGPIAGADLELAQIINRGVLRKLRSQVRKRVPVNMGENTRSGAIESVEDIFSSRMMVLIAERDAAAARTGEGQ